MTFAAPALLLGLLAIAAPIVIHLINRRRASRVRFPAVEFLLRSNRKLARRLKLKQLALLAARVAFFALIPLAMARPSMRCGATAATETSRLPASVVFVVDDSASMSASADRGNDLYAAAVETVERGIRELRPWDTAAVVVASTRASALVGELTEDRGEVVGALREYLPAYGASDLRAALVMAADIQAASRLPVRRTFVLSDGTASAWPDDPRAVPVAGLGALEIVDLSDGRRANVAVTDVRYARAASGGEDEYAIEASIRSWGAQGPGVVTATLRIDGAAVGSAQVELGASAEQVVTFHHTLEGAGPFEAEVRVAGDTGPVADDARTVPLQPERAARVLVVDGDPRAVAINDEVFFLGRALDLVVDGRREIEPTVVAADQLAATELDGYDVVVLANVGALAVPQVARLRAFVEQGGGVLLTAGGNVDPERWNSLLGPLLPKPVRSVRVLAEPGDPDAGILATRASDIDAGHPVGRVFALRGGESLRSALVYRYLLLEPAPDSEAEIVARFADGGPALIERTIGRGRVMLLTTSIDLDWTDLPLATAYVPLVRRVVEYLARRSGSAADQTAVGDRVAIDVAALRPTALVVHAPDGTRHVAAVEGDEVGVTPTTRGIHRVSVIGPGGDEVRVPELDFAANTPLSESDPAPVDGGAVEELVRLATEDVDPAGAGASVQGRGVWPTLLLVGLLVLYLESLLAARRRVWVRLAGLLRRRTRETAP